MGSNQDHLISITDTMSMIFLLCLFNPIKSDAQFQQALKASLQICKQRVSYTLSSQNLEIVNLATCLF